MIFLLCWGVQSLAGWAAYNSEQLDMLAVGSMAVLSVYLRQRRSPGSKPVGAAHDDTGQAG